MKQMQLFNANNYLTEKYTNLYNEVANKTLNQEELDTILINQHTNFRYLKKHFNISVEEVIQTKEYSLQEIVDFLNQLAGEDCWGCSWKYYVKNNKVYEDIVIDKLYTITPKE